MESIVGLGVYGLAVGVCLVGAFMAGFFACYRLRWWEKRALATEDYDRSRSERVVAAEQRILGHLDAEADREEAENDSSPMGGVPPMPGEFKRKRVVQRMREKLMGEIK